MRDAVLVYPREAQMPVTPLGSYAGRGGADRLSVGQTIKFQTPAHRTRSLTVLGISS